MSLSSMQMLLCFLRSNVSAIGKGAFLKVDFGEGERQVVTLYQQGLSLGKLMMRVSALQWGLARPSFI